MNSLKSCILVVIVTLTANVVAAAPQAWVRVDPVPWLLKGAELVHPLSLDVAYGLRTDRDLESLGSEFPDSAFGGVRAETRIAPESALTIGISQSLQFSRGHLSAGADPDYNQFNVRPVEILQSTQQGLEIPFTTSTIQFNDRGLQRRIYYGDIDYHSVWLSLSFQALATEAIPWWVTATIELEAVYADATGSVTGIISGADVDVGPFTAGRYFSALILEVPVEGTTWGQLKSGY